MLRLEHISKIYPTGEVLKDVNWEVKPGDRIGLVGVNGAGKMFPPPRYSDVPSAITISVADEEGGGVARVLRLGVGDGRAADEPVAVPAGLLTVRVGHDVVLGWRTDGDVAALR